MIEFGKTLRQAREAKGFTIAQIADLTNLTTAAINELEQENFTHIAAPIYGRGFVKLYCEAVGLEPKPMIAEFMEIFSGNRNPEIKERPIEPTANEVKDPAPVEEIKPITIEQPSLLDPPASDEPPVSAEPPPMPGVESAPIFSNPIEVQPESPAPIPAQTPAPAPTPAYDPIAAVEPSDEPRLSRYATPLHQTRISSISPAYWRLAILAAAAILVLWGLVSGIRALYRATSDAPAAIETPVPAIEEVEKASDKASDETTTPAKPKVKREPVKIPPLYLD